ncbi:MAG: hypothetical protein COA41_01910 [Sphingopyxis sp.]|nr:MAG: hypothetical protein COA41_01910 [Sphingopyxis sp.]
MFIVDDGSTDGTGDALRTVLPNALVITGTGDLYWNGGMCRAYELSRSQGSFDAYLMFNDDVFVLREKLKEFTREYFEINQNCCAILAAATESEIDQSITYSAKNLYHRSRPLALKSIPPNGKLQQCDTFNGNFVMFPGEFFEQVGGNDPKYVHAYGDIDLGLVAKKRGIPRFLASKTIGYCEANNIARNEAIRTKPFILHLNRIFFGSWGSTNDDIDQRLHYIFKHSESPLAYIFAAKSIVQYYLNKFRLRLIKKK